MEGKTRGDLRKRRDGRSPGMKQFVLLFLAANSLGAAGASTGPLADVSAELTEIRVPLPKPRIVAVDFPVPLIRSLPHWMWYVPPPQMFCDLAEWPEAEQPAHGLIELFGSEENFRSALAAEMIEVVELQPVDAELSTFGERAGGAVRLPEQDAAVLKAVLTYDAAYDWQAERPLRTREGFRLKFRTRGKVVALDIFPATRGAAAPNAGPVTRWARFDFGHPTVAATIAAHFPGATED